MNIGILGFGTVGKAIHEGLRSLGHNMIFYDTAYPESKFSDLLDCECVFVCVPTPSDENGDCNIDIVEQVVSQLNHSDYQGLIAIKSTVIPGTCNKLSMLYPNLRICSVPEFLRAQTALSDFMHNHDLLVVGTNNNDDFTMLKEMHQWFPKNSICVSPTEAEIIKYFNNVHHSMQVVFANIIYEISNKLDANYENIYKAISKRDSINANYMVVNKNKRSFGGHCLPKDTVAWNNLIKKLGLDFELIQSVISDNEKFK